MRFLAPLFALAACALPARAAGRSLVRTPVEDVGLPFWCDWGYDWDEWFASISPRPRLVISHVTRAGLSP
jgi:hypothetical protein